MKRVSLYSSSPRTRPPPVPEPAAEAAAAASAAPTSWRRRLGARLRQHERALLVTLSVVLTLFILWSYVRLHPGPRELTQKDIDGAVVHTLENLPPSSPAAKAYEIISPSVVRVVPTTRTTDGLMIS